MSKGLELKINGGAPSLTIISKELTFPRGQGGLLTQRLSLTLEAALPPISRGESWRIEYRDDNYKDRLGWKEIIVQPANGIDLLESSVPQQDQSQGLRNYPDESRYKPLEMTNAQLIFKPTQSATILPGQESQRDRRVHAEDRFSRLLTTGPLSLPVVLIALLSAMGLGALHAISPGHGKAIVAAYLVGSKGTPKHALFLGATVTLTHTFGVFLLGLVTLFASRYIHPEQLYPWLGTTSGLIVVGIGVTLFMKRLGFSKMGGDAINHRHEHGHGFHVHTHESETGHDKYDPHSHSHNPISRHHHHGHGAHEATKHGHDHSRDHEPLVHTYDIAVDHHHGDDHNHHGHSHLPPGMDGSPVTWRSLLALGISGGILPCPSALVVLLGAISLNRIGLGLILIVAFSIGLAGVLTIIGLFFVAGRDMLGRFTAMSRVVRFLPTASAFIIIILGVGITLNGLKEFFI